MSSSCFRKHALQFFFKLTCAFVSCFLVFFIFSLIQFFQFRLTVPLSSSIDSEGFSVKAPGGFMARVEMVQHMSTYLLDSYIRKPTHFCKDFSSEGGLLHTFVALPL